MDAIKIFSTKHADIEIILPSSNQYQDARHTYNSRITTTPVAIAKVKQAEDVADLVRLCVAEKIPLCVRSGGNDLFGRSIVDDALVIDVRALKHIEIDNKAQTAIIGGGMTSGLLASSLAEHGLVACVGTIEWIGYVGWATTGGFGPLAGKHGLGVDQIVAAKIVDATGQLVEADAETLRAIRGATGNFGIIVELTIRTYPISKVLAGNIIFESTDYWTSMEKVLDGIAKLDADGDQPPELELQPVYAQSPMGKIFGLVFFWAGRDHDRGQAYLSKVLSFAPVMMNTVAPCTLSGFLLGNAGLAQTQTLAAPYGLPIKTLTPKVLKIFKKYCDVLPEDLAVALTWHQLRQCSPSAVGQHGQPSVFSLREPHHVVEILSQAVDASNYEKVAKWGQDFRNELLEKVPEEILDSRWIPLTPDDEVPPLPTLFGKNNASFLTRLKKEKDPNNVFRHAIPRIAV